MKRVIKYSLIVVCCMLFLGFIINLSIIFSTKKQIISEDKYSDLKNIDCIVVLGAGVWGDKPSPILKDRLDKAIELYKKNLAPKILMSGDHGKKDYDEVNIMKEYAIEKGVPSEDIFMDHAGFSTYDTIYRAKEIFKAKKVIIVTQKYHLFRAIYISNKLGIDAYGVPAEQIKYSGRVNREIREVLARNKDFIKCIFKPKPTYLGEDIPINGDGNITNDNVGSDNMKLYIKVNDKILSATLVSNSSVEALIEKLQNGDITIDMQDYSNFEKVGELGFNLPTNDEQISTDYGDLILYLGNKFVIYYDKNSWNFTKIGKIDNITQPELKNILGNGDVTVTLSLNE